MSRRSYFLPISLLTGAILMALIACTSGDAAAPTTGPTPDIPAKIEIRIQATMAALPTATPLPTYTPFPTPRPSPNISSTVEAQVQATIAAWIAGTTLTISIPTPGPSRQVTPTATPTPVQSTAGIRADREALMVLYNSAGGPQWINDWNWTTDQPLGKWNGVTTNKQGRVTKTGPRIQRPNGDPPTGTGQFDQPGSPDSWRFFR